MPPYSPTPLPLSDFARMSTSVRQAGLGDGSMVYQSYLLTDPSRLRLPTFLDLAPRALGRNS